MFQRHTWPLENWTNLRPSLLTSYIFLFFFLTSLSRWWFQGLFICTPIPGEMIQFDPIWRIFFKWVETWNHQLVISYDSRHHSHVPGYLQGASCGTFPWWISCCRGCSGATNMSCRERKRESTANKSDISSGWFVHPRNLTWNLKVMVSKRNLLLQGAIFRFHVKFQGCRCWSLVPTCLKPEDEKIGENWGA